MAAGMRGDERRREPVTENIELAKGARVGRRTAVKAGLAALGGAALACLSSGCSVLGIENPNAAADQAVSDPGLIDFDGVEVRVNVEDRYWQWSVLDDTTSADNGKLVVAVPVSAVNADDLSHVISDMYCKVYGPDGTQQESLAGRYADDVRNTGNLAVDATVSGKIYLLYCGEGTYTVQFDNLLGRKPSVEFEVAYSAQSGVGPFPTNLNDANTAAAIPQGESFDVDGLTFTFGTDTAAYVWADVSQPGDAYWDGLGAVGIPLRVTNNSGQSMDFSSVQYRLYSSQTYMLSDASWAFPNSTANVFGTLAPNQTAQAYLYLAYEYSECTCYCVFCSDGMPLVASVWIP